MNKKYIDIALSIFFIILAVLLYRSTATFPKSALFTTAVYIKFLSILLFVSSIIYFLLSLKIDPSEKIIFTKSFLLCYFYL